MTINPAELWETRLQLHWAAQAAAGVGRTVLPAEPDFSHESFTWSAAHRALLGGGTLRAGIRLPDMTLVLVEGEKVAGELAMNGRTLADGFAFFERRCGSAPLQRPPEGMPDHPVAHGATFNANAAALLELDRRYAQAAEALEEVRRIEDGAGAVRCWPHHFDLATLITVSGQGEEAHTIGAGMTPGDESDHRPYFYVTPWPYPKDPPMPALSQGSWHTVGWFGAVLHAGERDDIPAFLREAIRHCRKLV